MDTVRRQGRVGIEFEDPQGLLVCAWDTDEDGLPRFLKSIGKTIKLLTLDEAQVLFNQLCDEHGVSSISAVRHSHAYAPEVAEHIVAAFRCKEDEIWMFEDTIAENILIHEFAHYWMMYAYYWPNRTFQNSFCPSSPLKMHGPVFLRAHWEFCAKYWKVTWRDIYEDSNPHKLECSTMNDLFVSWKEWRTFTFTQPTVKELEALEEIANEDHVNRVIGMQPE